MPVIGERLQYFGVSLSDGASIDLFLNLDSITNADQCAEGQSVDDEYRVVNTSMPGPYLDVPSLDHFKLVRQIGFLDVYQRE